MDDMKLDPPLDSYDGEDPYEDDVEWIEESYREDDDIDEDEEDSWIPSRTAQ